MGKKKDRVKREKYRPKSPKQTHKPHLCSCGEKLERITYIEEQGAKILRWRCPKCGIK